MDEMKAEHERILKAYGRRQIKAGNRFFRYQNFAHMCEKQERHRQTLRMMAAFGYHPLSDLRILDVGCGDGNMLRQYLQWGAEPQNVAGIELRPEPVDYAARLNPNLDIRCGSAMELPWPDSTFDLVSQHTVFTSILDQAMRQKIAEEMSRVLRSQGAVLWYDFFYNNPRNPDVRKASAKEIRDLFPDFDISLVRLSLAAPIARRLPERALLLWHTLLSGIPPLRTHYLGLFIKP